ncbi:hypothetical protein LJD49_29295, partial [Escherichia coli]|uniref:hypothetical protein n=1 Tax=Escherichia coli TaxID=562 RepID=UPI001D0A1FEA
GDSGSSESDDPTGRGAYDPATGLYEWYEREEQGRTWEEILEHWSLIVADFAEHYTIRLRAAPVMSWAEFADLVAGL